MIVDRFSDLNWLVQAPSHVGPVYSVGVRRNIARLRSKNESFREDVQLRGIGHEDKTRDETMGFICERVFSSQKTASQANDGAN